MQQITRSLEEQDRLLLSVSDQLKLPLTQIARMAELAQTTGQTLDYWKEVEVTAAAALSLVESYALSLRLSSQLERPELAPLTVSSLLYDTAESLSPMAKKCGVELQLDTGLRALPVLGDRQVLLAALSALGYVFIEGSMTGPDDDPVVLRLSAHRSRYGIVAGIYSSTPGMATDSLRRARALYGRARQPYSQLTFGPAAGVFVADSLLSSLSTRLHAARYHKFNGLAVTLTPGRQLQFV